MATNAETVQQIKESFINLKDNPTTLMAVNKFKEQREKLLLFVNKHKRAVIISVAIIAIIAIYLFVFHNRVNKYLNRMDVYDTNNIVSMQYNQEIMNGNFKLCDFYISSSYKSYLPCTNYYDYSSCEAIKRSLKSGARYIDLDVYNKDFNTCTTPIVCNGDEVGNYNNTTHITFDAACKTIANHAFSGNFISNPGDPMFLNINFKTWYNKDTIDKCAAIIKKHFQHRLLSKKYSYQGRYTNTNLATTPIKKLIGKLIIIASGDIKNTLMEEICNLHPEFNFNMRDMTHIEVKESYDPNELKEFNKRNITRVIPSFSDREKENYNFYTSYYLGCQFICMNFTEPTDFMKAYINKFKKCSLVLKPYKLRYKPTLIKAPLKQSKKVSFAPKKVTTPFYSITY
tara:strand:- start:3040 stop:4236 length:1197 start_codon:yes stop_codon:yes gene_type:complete